MKKQLLFSLFFLFFIIFGKAQESCGTKAPSEEWEQWFQTKIAERKADLASGRIQQTNYVIPVIVHIIHNGDAVGQSENISAAQVQSQIDILNADFAGNGYGVSNYPSASGWPSISNTGISFCLATQKPDGTALVENGIDRVNWQSKGWNNPTSYETVSDFFDNYIYATITPNTIWDPNKYLNIWVSDLNSIIRIGGAALLPTGTNIEDLIENESGEDGTSSGIWVQHKYFGNIGTVSLNSERNKGRSATHEIGHYLGLHHIFGVDDTTSACFTDYCEDTPPAQYKNLHVCPTGLYHKGTCIQPTPKYPNGNIINGEMYMNFMDYTNDECMYMFTPDQTIRMQTAMQYGTFRWTLNSSPACNSPSKPDFIVQNESLSVSSINAGSSLTTYHKVKNQGSGNSASSYTAIWLSKDQSFSATEDINLNADIAVPPLTSGQTSSQFTKSITIPSGTASGQWFIMFGADATTNYTNESNELNNQKFVPITIVNNTACSPTTPSGLSVSPSITSVYLSWNNISNVTYAVKYRKLNSSTWDYKYTSTNYITISSLSCGTTYEWGVQSICSSTSTSNYTTGNNFTTSSCGSTSAIDNCSQALLLNSNTSCSYIRTNVSNTTQSGLSIPSCSGYQSDFAYDVWFKFVAQSTSHTITVDPEGTYSGSNNQYIDPIIAIYTSCSASTPIDCADDTGGGGGNCDITVNGLYNGDTYYIRVFDYNKVSVILPTYSNFDICVTHSVPTCNPISNVSTSNYSQNSVTLNWNNGTGLNDVFLNYRAVGQTYYNSLGSVYGISSKTITGLTCGTAYEFYFISNCPNGTQYRTDGSFATSNCTVSCTAPYNLQLTSPPTQNSANLSWINGANINNVFLKYRKVGTSSWLSSPPLMTTTTSHQITGLECNTQYECYVYSNCVGGGSVSTFTNYTFTTAPCPIICASPSNLQVTPFTSSATFNWSIGAGSTSQELWYKKTSDLSYTKITDLSTLLNSYFLQGLACNTEYTAIIVTNCNGELRYSNNASFFTAVCVQNCTYSISPTIINNIPYTGYNGSLTVTAQTGCNYFLNFNCANITMQEIQYTGTHTFTYNLSSNAGVGPIRCYIRIVGQDDTLFLNQNGDPSCSFSLSRYSVNYTNNEQQDSVLASSSTNCQWWAYSNVNWITVYRNITAQGSNYVHYRLTANNSTSSRTGTITIGGLTYTITQAGLSCISTITPTSKSAPQIGLSDSLTVSLSNGCTWTAIANQTWITITSGSSGNGNGKVKYIVAQNNTGITRTGTITVAGKTFTITQSNIITAIYNNLIEDNYNVYPNPTNSILYIQSKENKSNKLTYSLNNLLGQAIEQNTIHINNYFEINLSNLPSGAYILNISDDKGNGSIKIIKE